jgi:hypothetical protein
VFGQYALASYWSAVFERFPLLLRMLLIGQWVLQLYSNGRGKPTKIEKPILGETLAASKSAVLITVVFAGTLSRQLLRLKRRS